MARTWAAIALVLAAGICPSSVRAQIPLPLTPIIGVLPVTLDFGSVPVGSHNDLTAELYNANSQPASLLRVHQITVAGTGFSLLNGPTLPVIIPGDGTRVPVTIRFAPMAEGLASGTLSFAANALPLAVPLSGKAPIEAVPIEVPIIEDIILGPDKELNFQGTDGEFTLHGGDILHFNWVAGVILLNGKRFQPGPSRSEYLLWKGPFRKADLTEFSQVPFVLERVSIYGDTDFGWHQAYTEWDSTVTSLSVRTQGYYNEQHSMSECRDFLLSLDPPRRVIDSAEIHEIGVKVTWLGLPGSTVIELPGQSPPAPPSLLTHAEAMLMLSSLRFLFTGTEASRVDLHFGNINTWMPGPVPPRAGGQ